MGLRTRWTRCKMDLDQGVMYLWLFITYPRTCDCDGVSVLLVLVSALPTCSTAFKAWIPPFPRYRFSGQYPSHLWGRMGALSLHLLLCHCQALPGFPFSQQALIRELPKTQNSQFPLQWLRTVFSSPDLDFFLDYANQATPQWATHASHLQEHCGQLATDPAVRGTLVATKPC